MKSIKKYTSLVVLITLLSLPYTGSAQSSEGRVVLTIEEFNSASEEKRQEVINNPKGFIVVKAGQKVDVWNRELKRNSAKAEEEDVSHAQRMEMERQAEQKAKAEQQKDRQRQELLERKPWLMSEEDQVHNGRVDQEQKVGNDQRPANLDDTKPGNAQQPSPLDADHTKGGVGGNGKSATGGQTIRVKEDNKLSDREKKGYEMRHGSEIEEEKR